LKVGGILILRGDYIKKEDYNFYLSEIARHINNGYFYFKGWRRLVFILGSPFCFLLPILNKYKFKDRILWNRNTKQKINSEYWNVENGLDYYEVMNLLKRDMYLVGDTKGTLGKSNFTNNLLKFFNVKNELNVLGIKLKNN
jgi:hypothetical protein